MATKQTTPAGETSPASVSRRTSSMSCPLRRGRPYAVGARRSRFRLSRLPRSPAALQASRPGRSAWSGRWTIMRRKEERPREPPPASRDEAEWKYAPVTSASGEANRMPPSPLGQGDGGHAVHAGWDQSPNGFAVEFWRRAARCRV